MLRIVDSHCHLDFEDFREDLPAVLERAKVMLVPRIVLRREGVEGEHTIEDRGLIVFG